MCSGAGAVWVWDKSKAHVRTSQLHASSTYVVLTHGNGHADIQARPGLFHLPTAYAGLAFAGLTPAVQAWLHQMLPGADLNGWKGRLRDGC